MEITTPDEHVVITVDMETGQDGRVRTVLEVDESGDKQSVDMIIAAPYVYVKVPDAGWTQLSARAMAETSGQSLEVLSNPTTFYSSLFPTQAVPWELYTVESLGLEQVDGVQAEHLSITFDFQQIWDHLAEEQKHQLLQASPDPEVSFEELIGAMQVDGVEVWIDDERYSRRTIMEIVFEGEGIPSLSDGKVSMKMDMRMFDINNEITIRLPEGYEDFEKDTDSRAGSIPTSAYADLLALIPDTPNTRSMVFLNDYVLLREELGIALPGPGAGLEGPSIYFESLVTAISPTNIISWGDAPYISGYSRNAQLTLGKGQYLAFDLRDVRHSALAGSPPGILGVMLGRFDPGATDSALENCVATVPDCEVPVRQSHEGVTFYSWGEDLQANLQRIFSPPAFDQLGRGGRIAVLDSHVFYTVETPGMHELIEASLQQRPSLMDVPAFRLLAGAMSQLETHASLLSDQAMSVEETITVLAENTSQEMVERIRAQFPPGSGLSPYQAFATGQGVDQDGPYLALALVHANAETAAENVIRLPQRINETSSFMTRMPWAQLVDKVDVRADGRVLLAKLHGRIARFWFAIVFNRDSLLVHGDSTSIADGTAPAIVPTATPFPTADTPALEVVAEQQTVQKEVDVTVADQQMTKEDAAPVVIVPTVAPPMPARVWELVDIQVDGPTVTVELGVYGDAGVTVALFEGRTQTIEFPSDKPPVFIFHNVASGRYIIRVTDEAGHEETAEIVVP